MKVPRNLGETRTSVEFKLLPLLLSVYCPHSQDLTDLTGGNQLPVGKHQSIEP